MELGLLERKDRTSVPDCDVEKPECSLAVVRDIYYLKMLAIEVVCQLALDTISRLPRDSALFSQLAEQVQEELHHLDQCRIFLSEQDAFGEKPDYVNLYSRLMRGYAGRSRRTLPLAVSVLLCISVEKSAMKQISRTSCSDRQMSGLLERLGTDEEDHYRLIASIVAPCAAAHASLLERIDAYVLMLRITLLTLRRWWPQRVADYQNIGLRVDIFLEEMLESAAQAIRPLGLFFPERWLLRVARTALRIS